MLTCEGITRHPPAEGYITVPWDRLKLNDIDLSVIKILFIYYSEQTMTKGLCGHEY